MYHSVNHPSCDWTPLFPTRPPVNHPSFSMWLDASLSHTPTCQSSTFLNVNGRKSFPHAHLSIIHLCQCDWTPLFPTRPPVNHPSLSMWLDASLFPHTHLSIVHLSKCDWTPLFSHTPTCQSSIFVNVIGRLSFPTHPPVNHPSLSMWLDASLFPHTDLSIVHLSQCDWTPLFPTHPPVNHPSLSMWLDASLFPHTHLSIVHLSKCDLMPLFLTHPPVNHPSLSMWLDASLAHTPTCQSSIFLNVIGCLSSQMSIIHLSQCDWKPLFPTCQSSIFLNVIAHLSIIHLSQCDWTPLFSHTPTCQSSIFVNVIGCLSFPTHRPVNSPSFSMWLDASLSHTPTCQSSIFINVIGCLSFPTHPPVNRPSF